LSIIICRCRCRRRHGYLPLLPAPAAAVAPNQQQVDRLPQMRELGILGTRNLITIYRFLVLGLGAEKLGLCQCIIIYCYKSTVGCSLWNVLIATYLYVELLYVYLHISLLRSYKD
jgi:hypothetical protein